MQNIKFIKFPIAKEKIILLTQLIIRNIKNEKLLKQKYLHSTIIWIWIGLSQLASKSLKTRNNKPHGTKVTKKAMKVQNEKGVLKQS